MLYNYYFSQEYLNNIEHQIKENNDEIIIKRQQIYDENIKIKYIKNDIVNKNKIIADNQHLIEQKRLQLQV